MNSNTESESQYCYSDDVVCALKGVAFSASDDRLQPAISGRSQALGGGRDEDVVGMTWHNTSLF